MNVKLDVVINRGTRKFLSKLQKEIVLTTLICRTSEGKVYDVVLFGSDACGVKDGQKIDIEMTSFCRSQRTREMQISGHLITK